MFLVSAHRAQVIPSHRKPAFTSIHYITVTVFATASIKEAHCNLLIVIFRLDTVIYFVCKPRVSGKRVIREFKTFSFCPS